MPDNTSQGVSRKPLEWIKESGILAVTLTGLALYFFLSIPATLFYSQLGTTPGEVGINYVNLLSGSTYEMLVIFVVLAIGVFFGGSLLAYFVMGAYSFAAFLYPWKMRGRRQTREQRTTWAFDQNLRLYTKMPEWLQTRAMLWPGFPKTFAELEALMERRLELLKISDLTQEQSAELASIEVQLSFPRKARRRKDLIRAFVTVVLVVRHRIRLLVMLFTLVIIVIVLPVMAYIQAGQIRDGHAYFASDTGIFDYSADPVNIYPIAPNISITVIARLEREKLYLLGQNTAYAVLYSPSDHATIRVPITTVIITAIQSLSPAPRRRAMLAAKPPDASAVSELGAPARAGDDRAALTAAVLRDRGCECASLAPGLITGPLHAPPTVSLLAATATAVSFVEAPEVAHHSVWYASKARTASAWLQPRALRSL